MRVVIRWIPVVLCALLTACASRIDTQQVAITHATGPAVEVTQDTPVLLSTGYRRVLARGSRWLPMGQVPQGLVYRPADTVFTIEGRDVHEAYLVVSVQRLVGFYLPGEHRFSPLSQPLSVPLKEIP